MILMLLMISYFYSRAFQIDTKLYTYTFPFILYPLNHISFLASIYITVAMAYERYIAVCRPLHYRDVTTRYTVQRRTIGYAAIRFIEVAISNIIMYFSTNTLLVFWLWNIYFQVHTPSNIFVHRVKYTKVPRT